MALRDTILGLLYAERGDAESVRGRLAPGITEERSYRAATVLDALRRLEREGLVVREPGTAAEATTWDLTDRGRRELFDWLRSHPEQPSRVTAEQLVRDPLAKARFLDLLSPSEQSEQLSRWADAAREDLQVLRQIRITTQDAGLEWQISARIAQLELDLRWLRRLREELRRLRAATTPFAP